MLPQKPQHTLPPVPFVSALVLVLLLAAAGNAQQFGGKQILANSADGAISAFASDLDGDGDLDVLSASLFDDTIAWYENLGAGAFSSKKIISLQADEPISVMAIDLDSDGDPDVLSASRADDKIAWYSNNGGGQFGGQQVISFALNAPYSVFASDLDGDGDADIISCSSIDNKVSWFENRGSGSFGVERVLSNTALEARDVFAADLDGDGDEDILSASMANDKIAWYENIGNGDFKPESIITMSAASAHSVFACDLDGDGDRDVLSASARDDKIAWYENLGGGVFGGQLIISTSADYARSVFAADLDGDGDNDVLSASQGDNKVAWYENLGGGTFGAQQIVYYPAIGAASVFAADLDGDGDQDVISASLDDDTVAWYENLMGPDSDQDGLSDVFETSLGTDPFDQDTDDDGLSDGEEVLTPRPDPRWLQAPGGSWARLSAPTNWNTASASARAEGFELAAVQDQATADWLASTFSAASDSLGSGFWIGLNDFGGTPNWSNGDPVSFTNWATSEPSVSPYAAFVGGSATTEPGRWYADLAGLRTLPSVWEAPGPDRPETTTDPLAFDSDGDGLGDGQEDGLDQIVWNGDPINGILGTDPAVFVPDADPLSTSSPLDSDSDDDGVPDGLEDRNGDGARTGLETRPDLPDTDGDGLTDGLELGATAPTLDTDPALFVADADPLTTTKPTKADSDGGGLRDGVEDWNRNGAIDLGESDPNNPLDDTLQLHADPIYAGGTATFHAYGGAAGSWLYVCYSLAGPGPTTLPNGLVLDLGQPIQVLTPFRLDRFGEGHLGPLPVPPSVSSGTPVWFQGVDFDLFGTTLVMVSNGVFAVVQ